MASFPPTPVSQHEPDQPPKLLIPASSVQDPWMDTVRRLERGLAINQQRFLVLQAYYSGQHPSSVFSSVQFQQNFSQQLRGFADNWLRLVIAATNNRLRIQGFRVAGEGDTTDLSKTAWRVWKANRLRQGSRIAHRDAMKYGTSFVLVDPLNPHSSGEPRITVESPFEVIGERDPANRYQLTAAVKKWAGQDGSLYLNLYTPQIVLKYKASASTAQFAPNQPDRVLQGAAWRQIDEVSNPLGVVPIVPIENEPDLMLGGLSDLEDLIPLNDGLNKTVRDMMVASEYQAFRQRYVTGVDIPKDPETGKPLTEKSAQLQASKSRVWMFPSPDAKVGELGQIDLTPYISAIDMFIHHISMVSTTPAYMLVGRLANLSADALRAAELGFVGKLHGKQTDYGVSWEQVMILGFGAMGAEALGADTPGQLETLWSSAAAHSGSILSNELTQMVALGMPREIAWERYGASPEEVSLWAALNAANPDQAEHAALAASISGRIPGLGPPPDDGSQEDGSEPKD